MAEIDKNRPSRPIDARHPPENNISDGKLGLVTGRLLPRQLPQPPMAHQPRPGDARHRHAIGSTGDHQAGVKPAGDAPDHSRP